MDPQEESTRDLPQVKSTNDDTSGIVTGAQPVQADPNQVSPAAAKYTSDDGMPLEAEDIDLIEKAWVEKAKDIVDSTQGDPYDQNEKLSKMKSDYLKKRYDKDIKPKG